MKPLLIIHIPNSWAPTCIAERAQGIKDQLPNYDTLIVFDEVVNIEAEIVYNPYLQRISENGSNNRAVVPSDGAESDYKSFVKEPGKDY